MKDPKQLMRFTDTELSLIKGLFAGNDELLAIIRKVLLQFPLTEQEAVILKGAMNDTTIVLMYKVLLPHIDPESPLFQLTHMVVSLGGEIKTLSPEGAWPFIQAKRIEMEYIAQQLKVLGGDESKPEIVLADLAVLDAPKTKKEEVYINVTAYNYLLSFIDSNIQQLRLLAGMKEETIEQTKERLSRNSAK